MKKGKVMNAGRWNDWLGLAGELSSYLKAGRALAEYKGQSPKFLENRLREQGIHLYSLAHRRIEPLRVDPIYYSPLSQGEKDQIKEYNALIERANQLLAALQPMIEALSTYPCPEEAWEGPPPPLAVVLDNGLSSEITEQLEKIETIVEEADVFLYEEPCIFFN